MAKNTGTGSRNGTVTARSQVRNPKTGDFVKRDETPGSARKGEFMDVKQDGQRFKGIAEEKDKRGSTAERSTQTASAKGSRARGPAKPANGKRIGRAAVLARQTPARKQSDALSLLVADHKEVRQLFRAYERLKKAKGGAADRKQLAQQICRSLSVHAQIEEEIFYPAARAAKVEQDLIDEAEVEHASAKALISQIERLAATEKNFDAKVTVLGEYIDHHVKEEETEMFPRCRRSSMDLVALKAQLQVRKAELTKSEPLVIRLARKAIDALLPDTGGRTATAPR
jgi:hemerythrin-like domain-containing protein